MQADPYSIFFAHNFAALKFEDVRISDVKQSKAAPISPAKYAINGEKLL